MSVHPPGGRRGGAAGVAGAFAVVAAVTASVAARPQIAEPPPVFRSGVQTVAVYVSVLDAYGGMVQDLPREDFQVLDDGKAQPLTLFANSLQPITAQLLVDTSASMTLNLDVARAAAEQFVLRMLPGDRARVGSFSDRIDLSRGFTNDRDALLTALREGLHIGNPTKLWDAVLETLTDLAPLGGRRVILLFTDGMDTFSTAKAGDVLARAREDETMIYVVQFRSNQRANLAELPIAPTVGEVFAGDPRFRNPAPTDALRALATQTGGGHFLLGQFDDLNATFTEVVHELHYQYLLGFTPQKLDGKLHDIRVKITRPDLTVRARQNYLAPKSAVDGRTP